MTKSSCGLIRWDSVGEPLSDSAPSPGTEALVSILRNTWENDVEPDTNSVKTVLDEFKDEIDLFHVDAELGFDPLLLYVVRQCWGNCICVMMENYKAKINFTRTNPVQQTLFHLLCDLGLKDKEMMMRVWKCISTRLEKQGWKKNENENEEDEDGRHGIHKDVVDWLQKNASGDHCFQYAAKRHLLAEVVECMKGIPPFVRHTKQEEEEEEEDSDEEEEEKSGRLTVCDNKNKKIVIEVRFTSDTKRIPKAYREHFQFNSSYDGISGLYHLASYFYPLRPLPVQVLKEFLEDNDPDITATAPPPSHPICPLSLFILSRCVDGVKRCLKLATVPVDWNVQTPVKKSTPFHLLCQERPVPPDSNSNSSSSELENLKEIAKAIAQYIKKKDSEVEWDTRNHEGLHFLAWMAKHGQLHLFFPIFCEALLTKKYAHQENFRALLNGWRLEGETEMARYEKAEGEAAVPPLIWKVHREDWELLPDTEKEVLQKARGIHYDQEGEVHSPSSFTSLPPQMTASDSSPPLSPDDVQRYSSPDRNIIMTTTTFTNADAPHPPNEGDESLYPSAVEEPDHNVSCDRGAPIEGGKQQQEEEEQEQEEKAARKQEQPLAHYRGVPPSAHHKNPVDPAEEEEEEEAYIQDNHDDTAAGAYDADYSCRRQVYAERKPENPKYHPQQLSCNTSLPRTGPRGDDGKEEQETDGGNKRRLNGAAGSPRSHSEPSGMREKNWFYSFPWKQHKKK